MKHLSGEVWFISMAMISKVCLNCLDPEEEEEEGPGAVVVSVAVSVF